MAGTPLRFSFSPQTDVFDMAYVPNHRIHAPTVIFVPTGVHYRHGYCARSTGARVTSARGSNLLEVRNDRTGTHVSPCRSRRDAASPGVRHPART